MGVDADPADAALVVEPPGGVAGETGEVQGTVGVLVEERRRIGPAVLPAGTQQHDRSGPDLPVAALPLTDLVDRQRVVGVPRHLASDIDHHCGRHQFAAGVLVDRSPALDEAVRCIEVGAAVLAHAEPSQEVAVGGDLCEVVELDGRVSGPDRHVGADGLGHVDDPHGRPADRGVVGPGADAVDAECRAEEERASDRRCHQHSLHRYVLHEAPWRSWCGHARSTRTTDRWANRPNWSRRCGQRPRTFALDDPRRVEEPRLVVVGRHDLHADRETVDLADGNRDAGVAVEVRRDREPAVVGGGVLHTAERVGERALGPEGDVGVGRRDHEVGLLEQRRHGFEQGGAPVLQLDAGVHPVPGAGGPFAREAHLGGEVVGARGPGVAQRRERPGHVRERPGGTDVGDRHVHVDDGQLEVAGELFAGLANYCCGSRADDGAGEPVDDRDAQALHVVEVATEPGLPPVDAGE